MSERLKPILASMAEEFGLIGDPHFKFCFPEIAGTRIPSYNPDVVWFSGQPIEAKALAIFEIDEEPSRKHRVGGAAFANIVALKIAKRVRYFAIVPPNRKLLASSCLDILRIYLQDKWLLEAIVIPSFDPALIREEIRTVGLDG